jgi:hypothetical protein
MDLGALATSGQAVLIALAFISVSVIVTLILTARSDDG